MKEASHTPGTLPPRRVPRKPTLRAFCPLRRALLSARGTPFSPFLDPIPQMRGGRKNWPINLYGAPLLGPPPPPQPRPEPHHPRPSAPRRQRRIDADERGRSGRPLLFQPPREGGLPRCLGACSHCYCCLDPIPPTEGGVGGVVRGVPFRALSSLRTQSPERNTPNQKRPLGGFWRLVAWLVQRMFAGGATAHSHRYALARAAFSQL